MAPDHNSWPQPLFASQVANSIRVIKTKKQTSSENCSYISAAQQIIEKDPLDWIRWQRECEKYEITGRAQCEPRSCSKCLTMTRNGQRVEWVWEWSSRKRFSKIGRSNHPTLLQDGVAGIFFRGLSTRVSWCKFRQMFNVRPRSCGYLWIFTVELGAPQNWKNDTRHMYLIGWWHQICFCFIVWALIWFGILWPLRHLPRASSNAVVLYILFFS